MSRLVVVGGGLAGLAAAVRLGHAGHQVTLLEKNDRTGGKMNLIEEGGFVFDTGPTILTMPQSLDRIFTSIGRKREDYLDLVQLDPQWRAFFEDGQVIDIWQDRVRMVEQIRKLSEKDAQNYDRFRLKALEMYGLAESFFFWKSVDGLKDMLKGQDLLSLEGLKLLKVAELHSTVSKVINRHFKEPHLRQILEHFMQYVGSSPQKVPAILASIHHIQLEFGVWYPMGGMRRIAEVLTDLALECGVDLKLETTVERFLVEGGRLAGVEAGGEIFLADAVVANSDFVRSHLELLPSTKTRRKIERRPKRYEPAVSGVVIYFGMKRKYDQLWHHDFFFSNDPEREFDDIYRKQIPTQDPTLCICSPSRTDASVAPDGCENIYVLVHTPYLQGNENWEALYPTYRNLIVQKLERCGLSDFGKQIQVERWMTPQDIHDRYRVDRGAIYGITSHGKIRGAFKPANRSKDFDNLYFCGGSVNPGPGVPMALMSGQTAADCLLEDLGTRIPRREAELAGSP